MHRHHVHTEEARVDKSIRRAAASKYERLAPGSNAATTGIVPVIIEVPRDQRNKLEFEKDTGTLELDRVLHSSCHYPGDYGFVPMTLCPDGDPIDVLVLSKFALTPGVVADCRIVGVMDMEDEKGGDAKLIAVVASEPRSLSVQDIKDVPAHVKAEVQQFFELYKSLESTPQKPKWVNIRSWGDRKAALKELQDSINLFEKKHASEVSIGTQLKVGNVYELGHEMTETNCDRPELACAYIEVQSGDANKYEWDKETGFLTLDRVLHSSIFYPGDYGFIPRTLCGDGDPLDVIVLSSYSITPGTFADVRIVGALNMADEKGEDQKLLAVVDCDPRWDEVQDLADVDEHTKREIAQFFETYKELENKPACFSPGMAAVIATVAVPGLSETTVVEGRRPHKKTKFATIKGWMDKKGALTLLDECRKAYQPAPDGLGEFGRLRRLHIGDSAPSMVNAIVRAPKGTNIRYDVLSKVGLMKMDKVMCSAVVYPGDFCSLPQTLAEDGKAVEAVCLSVFPLPLGSIVEMRVVAMLNTEDQNGPNSKIIGVPKDEPRLSEYLDVDSIPTHVKKEVQEFFNTYKALERGHIWAKVTGWSDRVTAMQRIDDCRKRWFSVGLKFEEAADREEALQLRVAELEARELTILARLDALEGGSKKKGK